MWQSECTLKILDVRLQHVQSNCKSEEQTREDITHIRIVVVVVVVVVAVAPAAAGILVVVTLDISDISES